MQPRHVLLFHYVPTIYSKRKESQADRQTERQTPDLPETTALIASAYFRNHILIIWDL